MKPPNDPIPLSAPTLRGREWEYVKECLDTGWVSSAGAYVRRFETEFAASIGARGAVCASSGTSALHIAALLAGLEPDQEVIVPSLTFIAPVNVIRYVGAWPVFVDSHASTWQIDPEGVRSFLENECSVSDGVFNKTTGRRVAAILPVHLLGYVVDLAPIYEIAEAFGLPVIEDATEGLGALYRGSQLGSDARFACFSFNGNKLITTGGGGMFVSNDIELLLRAKHLTTQAKCDPNEYVHDEVGYNYRLPNLLSAVGCAQLEQLAGFIEAKHAIARRYNEAFGSDERIEFIEPCSGAEPVEWLYTIKLARGLDSRGLIAHLKEHLIESRPLWEPNHLSRAHRDAQRRSCPVAEDLFHRCVSLPCSSNLETCDQDRVVDAVRAFLNC